MKLIREHINEKFDEESDPIVDLEIGIKKQIDKFFDDLKQKPHNSGWPHMNLDDVNNRLRVCSFNGNEDFVRYLLSNGADPSFQHEKPLRNAAAEGHINVAKILIKAGASIEKAEAYCHSGKCRQGIKQLKDQLETKKSVNEKFESESDPITDMGIGKKQLIKQWLEKYRIKNYNLNDDLTINVATDVNLASQLLGNFPDYIQFYYISGNFNIQHNNITSLKGCPQIVNGMFSCSNNQLTTLKYSPKEVNNQFFCHNNKRQFTKNDVLKYCKVQKIYV